MSVLAYNYYAVGGHIPKTMSVTFIMYNTGVGSFAHHVPHDEGTMCVQLKLNQWVCPIALTEI